MNFAAGQLVDQPRFHRAEHQLARVGLLPRTGHVVQDPLQLGCRKIGVQHKAGFLADHLGVPLRLQLVADGGGAAALPDDGAADRLAGFAVPDDGRFALVGDADGRNVGGGGPDPVHGRKRHAQLGGPDLVGVMLDPARLGEILGKFLLRHAAHTPVVVKQDAAVGGGACVQRHDILLHTKPPFLVFVIY